MAKTKEEIIKIVFDKWLASVESKITYVNNGDTTHSINIPSYNTRLSDIEIDHIDILNKLKNGKD